MFYIPTSTEVFGGIVPYATGAWQNFSPFIALVIGLFVGVAVVLVVISLLKRGTKAVMKKAHGGR